LEIYLQGLLLGLSYCAPIGMQNLFVIDTALTQHKRRIYLTAAIVIFFDITLGLACFLGIGALMEALPWLQKVILAVGSLLVLYIGFGLVRSKADLSGGKDVNVPLWRAAATACVVTWCNPQAIIDGTMMLGACKATLPAGTDGFFIAGFASASALWFNFLGTLVSVLGSRINERVLTAINRICGAVILFYGCKLAYGFVKLMGWL